MRARAGRRKRWAQTSAETGLPGRPTIGVAAEPSGEERLAGAHGDAVEREVEAAGDGGAAHEVEVADRGAAEGDDEVGAPPRAADGGEVEDGGEVLGRVAGDREEQALAALLLDHRLQAVVVRGEDPVGADRRRRGGTSSSPVGISATAGRRWTVTWPAPIAARRVTSATPRRRGRGDAGAGDEVAAGGADVGIAVAALADGDACARRRERSTSSWMTMKSAPSGTGAPV